jgi:hypothetical protein
MIDKTARPSMSLAERAAADEKRNAVVFAEEAKRVASDAAKTAKLRDLREARDAAERDASAPAIIPTRPGTKPKVRVLRPGVRLRK